MGRNLLQEMSRLTKRVDQHDRDISDLYEMSNADSARISLQQEGFMLLRRLGENHHKRITIVERAVLSIRRRIARRGRR